MRSAASLYMGLVHYPVLNRRGEVIASAITNVDIHDLARLAVTYGVNAVYVITPLGEQERMVRRIVRHWTHGIGGTLNPDRKTALESVLVAPSVETVRLDIEQKEGTRPLVVLTGAAPKGRVVSYGEMRRILGKPGAVLILFGTAWGLAWEKIPCADRALEPIRGCGDYNHLSVRSAASIVLDRLRRRD